MGQRMGHGNGCQIHSMSRPEQPNVRGAEGGVQHRRPFPYKDGEPETVQLPHG